MLNKIKLIGCSFAIYALLGCFDHAHGQQNLKLQSGDSIALVGGTLGSRMIDYGYFEAGLQMRYPDLKLTIRNMCDEGDTPAFRPHSGYKEPWAYPGAENSRAWEGAKQNWPKKHGSGFNPKPHEWLEHYEVDVVIGMFGFAESFDGKAGLSAFQQELDAYVKYTMGQKYNGKSGPKMALVSPVAFQDLSEKFNTPSGVEQNANLAMYAMAVKEVAEANGIVFVDMYSKTRDIFATDSTAYSRDGALLNDAGYQMLSPMLLDGLFGTSPNRTGASKDDVLASVREKNWMWLNYYKIPNGVHVYGTRHKPFGPGNYPFELEKLDQMVAARDQAIWAKLNGGSFDLAAADAKTNELPEVKTNIRGEPKYLSPEESHKTIKTPEGYKVELFADEERFPDLANPCQMAFDNKGRLWVAVMPSYPHYRPGDPKPNDKLLILEDTDGDYKADKQTVFAEDLHLVMGFEITHDGVYIAQGYQLIQLRDTDGDDKADFREVALAGFSDHDTHHAISAFCADPSGAFMMGEGIFLLSNVETAYGPVRSHWSGFHRYNPTRRKLERTVSINIPNPWGIAFDEWGQNFFLHTSSTRFNWMLPAEVQVGYGNMSPTPRDLLTSNQVRPTSGLEFVSSRHFPDEVQGDVLINNNIGFLGTKQHAISEDKAGYTTEFRHDLLQSNDPNFRPVDMEFAPDGSLYVTDWHNALIGHMQHSARDPNRDHAHGRVYRVTYPSRPLVQVVPVAGASIDQLLSNLELPEYRTRYRSRRELRARSAGEVLPALKSWVAKLDSNDSRYDHHLLEAMWVTWGLDELDADIVHKLLASSDHRVRAAATRAIRYNAHHLPDHVNLLRSAAADAHDRVRMEAVVAASWMGKDVGLDIVEIAESAPKPVAGDNPKAKPNFAKKERDGSLNFTHPSLASTKVDEITIGLPGNGRILNLSEIVAISNGKDIIKQAKGSQSSRYNNVFLTDKMIDGKVETFAHSRESESNPWFKFKFDKPVKLDKVKVWNRPKYEDRFSGGFVAYSVAGKEVGRMSMGKAATSDWLRPVVETAFKALNGEVIEERKETPNYKTKLTGADRKSFMRGSEIYNREAHCGTCHQPNGRGLPAAQFPPLVGTRWIRGSEERLIKLALHGMAGPIEVKGRTYPGLVPMTAFKALSDQEMADVLTFVRDAFGDPSKPVSVESVIRVREQTKDRANFWSPKELLAEHPLEASLAVENDTESTFVNKKLESELVKAAPAELAKLALERGNAKRGERIFRTSPAACAVCHAPQNGAAQLGPNLAKIKSKLDDAGIVEAILNPSKVIDKEFAQVTVITDDGKVITGAVVSETDDEIVLRNMAMPNPVTIPMDEVEDIMTSKKSLMPEGLAQQFRSRREFDDLIRYLIEVKNKK